MTTMTAACTVELWISTDHDPTGTRRLLILEYPEMVRTRMPVSLAAEIMTQGYPRGGKETEFNFDLWDWFMVLFLFLLLPLLLLMFPLFFPLLLSPSPPPFSSPSPPSGPK